MRYALLAGLATAGVLAASAASAMPLNNLSAAVQGEQGAQNGIEQVRLVCNRWGRCWNTGPRAYYGYYGPRYYPRYGYYGRPYGYGYGAPGVGFNFRF